MAASYDDERRFLGTLSTAQGPFFLIGFDATECTYVLELLRDQLKTLGHHLYLSDRLDASSASSLATIESAFLGLFDTQGWQIVEGVDSIKKDQIPRWLQAIHASPLRLILTSSKKLESAWTRAFQGAASQGVALRETPTLDVSGEKPWDKPKRLSAWVQAMVASMGMQIDFRQASLLCERLSGDRHMIKTQVQALAAAQGYSGPLKLDSGDLEASGQVWKWLDQIWQSQVGLAFAQVPLLLEEDPSGISLLALVRQQWHALILSLETQGSPSGPYDRMQQKAQRARQIGYAGLCRGADWIAKAQWDLKSSRACAEVLQLLIVRLSAICNPKSSFAGER